MANAGLSEAVSIAGISASGGEHVIDWKRMAFLFVEVEEPDDDSVVESREEEEGWWNDDRIQVAHDLMLSCK